MLVCSPISELGIDLVTHDDEVFLASEFGYTLQYFPFGDSAGGIGREIEKEGFATVFPGSFQGCRIQGKIIF